MYLGTISRAHLPANRRVTKEFGCLDPSVQEVQIPLPSDRDALAALFVLDERAVVIEHHPDLLLGDLAD